MKKIILSLIMLALMFACKNTNQPAQSASESTTVEMTELELHVTGMTCEGCENSIIKALGRLDGVGEVTASHLEEKVVLQYDPNKVSTGQIAETITKTGYTVHEDPATEPEVE